MRFNRLATLALATGFCLGYGFVTPSAAGVIGPLDCDSCFGVEYSLDNLGNQDGGSLTQDVWRIRLTANTTDYTGSPDHWISAVSVKVFSNKDDIIDVVLFSTTAPGADWPPAEEGKVNNCGGNGNGAVCTTSELGLALTDGSTYEWIFDITTLEGTPFIDTPSFQVDFWGLNPNNDREQRQGITSENISLGTNGPPPPSIRISEPYPLAVLGFALLVFGALRYRAAGRDMRA